MKSFFLACSLFSISTCFAQNRQITVAQDGSANYRTVQAALDAVPSGNRTFTTIFIKKGVYKEKLSLKQSFVKLVGEDLLTTVLTYDDYKGRILASGEEITTTTSATFRIHSNNITAENLTFENSAGPRYQAVALWAKGDKVQFKNCRFLGFKDTIYLSDFGNRQYYSGCYIEGTTDIIAGSNCGFFEDCTIFCKVGGTCITAASTADTARYGYVFQRCKVVGDAPADSYFLGRPWKPFAKTVFLYCELGPMVKPAGWDERGKDLNKQDAFYAEYKCTGPGAGPKKRVLWAHQLTPEQAVFYTRDAVLRGWKPDK